jgi:hypothetical protein
VFHSPYLRPVPVRILREVLPAMGHSITHIQGIKATIKHRYVIEFILPPVIFFVDNESPYLQITNGKQRESESPVAQSPPFNLSTVSLPLQQAIMATHCRLFCYYTRVLWTETHDSSRAFVFRSNYLRLRHFPGRLFPYLHNSIFFTTIL